MSPDIRPGKITLWDRLRFGRGEASPAANSLSNAISEVRVHIGKEHPGRVRYSMRARKAARLVGEALGLASYDRPRLKELLEARIVDPVIENAGMTHIPMLDNERLDAAAAIGWGIKQFEMQGRDTWTTDELLETVRSNLSGSKIAELIDEPIEKQERQKSKRGQPRATEPETPESETSEFAGFISKVHVVLDSNERWPMTQNGIVKWLKLAQEVGVRPVDLKSPAYIAFNILSIIRSSEVKERRPHVYRKRLPFYDRGRVVALAALINTIKPQVDLFLEQNTAPNASFQYRDIDWDAAVARTKEDLTAHGFEGIAELIHDPIYPPSWERRERERVGKHEEASGSVGMSGEAGYGHSGNIAAMLEAAQVDIQRVARAWLAGSGEGAGPNVEPSVGETVLFQYQLALPAPSVETQPLQTAPQQEIVDVVESASAILQDQVVPEEPIREELLVVDRNSSFDEIAHVGLRDHLEFLMMPPTDRYPRFPLRDALDVAIGTHTIDYYHRGELAKVIAEQNIIADDSQTERGQKLQYVSSDAVMYALAAVVWKVCTTFPLARGKTYRETPWQAVVTGLHRDIGDHPLVRHIKNPFQNAA